MSEHIDETTLEVQSVHDISGRGYILAQLVKPSDQVVVTTRSTLNGSPVEQWIDAPRATDAQGHQRRDLFAFCLQSRIDLARFEVGQRVRFESDGVNLDLVAHEVRSLGRDSVKWLEPWSPVDDGGGLERELMCELGSAHLLYGMRVQAIARR